MYMYGMYDEVQGIQQLLRLVIKFVDAPLLFVLLLLLTLSLHCLLLICFFYYVLQVITAGNDLLIQQ